MKLAGPACAAVQREAGSDSDRYLGVTGVAAPEGLLVQHRQVLLHRPAGGLGRQAGGALDRAPVAARVGPDQAGVHCEALAAHQALGHAAPHRRLEQLAHEIAVAESAVPVLGEGGVVGDVALQPQPAEPAIGEIEVHLLAQPPLGADAQAVADQQHADHQLGIDRRTADRAVEVPQVLANALQIDEPVDGPEQVILRHVPLQRELVEERALICPPLAHHGRISRSGRTESAPSHRFNRPLFQRHQPKADLSIASTTGRLVRRQAGC